MGTVGWTDKVLPLLPPPPLLLLVLGWLEDRLRFVGRLLLFIGLLLDSGSRCIKSVVEKEEEKEKEKKGARSWTCHIWANLGKWT